MSRVNMESKISGIIEGTVKKLGFSLVKVTIHGDRRKVVEILIEREDGQKIQVDDCRLVSRNISAILDVEDIISGKYFLEVSSAGLERPLVKIEDFTRFADRQVKISLKEALNGSTKYKGKLLGIDGKNIVLKLENDEISFDYSNIRKANLVFTDEEFKSLLNKK